MISISPETTTKRPAATSPCLINNSPAFTGCVFPAVAIRAIWEGVSVGNSCSRRSGDKTGAVSGVAMASIRCARVYPGLSMLMDSKKLEGEVLAERQGFEPWIPVKVYTLSKRAPSATRPSLRREFAHWPICSLTHWAKGESDSFILWGEGNGCNRRHGEEKKEPCSGQQTQARGVSGERSHCSKRAATPTTPERCCSTRTTFPRPTNCR